MGRLPGFDYKRPFFYMVTLKGTRSALCKTLFCSISEKGEVVANAITEAFERVIRTFHEIWYCIEPIRYYVIMPDHLHLIIKMRDIDKRVSLAVVVRQLLKALESAAAEAPLQNQTAGRQTGDVAPEAQLQNPPEAQLPNPAAGGGPAKPVLQGSLREPLFEHEWHDWIVKKEGQLTAFRKYILENPSRFARRRANRQFFTCARQITFRGARYWAYGNEALLELPVIVALKGHRRPPEAALQSQMRSTGLLAAAARIGPGGAGLSTFLSPLEKAAGNAIIAAGGALIVLSMQGFAERWHPTEKQERLCAAGRMLYLSPYEPQSTKLDKKEMYIRAHALVDWALEHSHYHLEAWP